MKTLASIFIGPPLTTWGKHLEGNPHVEIIAKAFVYAWLLQVAITFMPLMGHSRQIYASFTDPNFLFDFVDGAFWKAVMAVVGILSDSPFDDNDTNEEKPKQKDTP